MSPASCEIPQFLCNMLHCLPQTESIGRTDRGDVGTNTEFQSEALSASSTGGPDPDEAQSQADKWSILNDEVRGRSPTAGCNMWVTSWTHLFPVRSRRRGRAQPAARAIYMARWVCWVFIST